MGLRLLAMSVTDDAYCLNQRVVLQFIASRLNSQLFVQVRYLTDVPRPTLP